MKQTKKPLRSQVTRLFRMLNPHRNGTLDAGQQNGMTPERCATNIFRAVEREKDEVAFGGQELMALYLKRFWPGLLNRILRKAKVT